jgi:hypothetical protein
MRKQCARAFRRSVCTRLVARERVTPLSRSLETVKAAVSLFNGEEPVKICRCFEVRSDQPEVN